MGDQNLSDRVSESSSPVAPELASALERMRDLLGSKDDTSRFVGLALLKSILDNQPQLREDVAQLLSIWDAIPLKFLDRLLKSGQNRNVVKKDASNLVDIAVAVLHTFAILLPVEARSYKSLVGRSPALINALIYSSPKSTVLILQTLLTFASQLPGTGEIINIEDLSPLTEISLQYPMVLDVLSMVWSNASTDITQVSKVKSSIDKTIPMLLNTFKGTDGVTLMTSIGNTLGMLPPGVVSINPAWLTDLVVMLRKLVTSRPNQAARSAYTQLSASLLQACPLKCHSLLFEDRQPTIKDDSKPFSYLFISLILIDIRSTIPSLLSKLNSSEYPTILKRLESAFDVVTHFIGFLIQTLDDGETPPAYSFSMPPDILLKMRKNIAETMSLTIEYLRNRWDASVAGAAGLHPSARTGTTATSEGTRLTLTWDAPESKVHQDGMILASFRTLALWLSEDENDSLRKEMGGLMDMLLELYQGSTISESLDFRSATLKTLEAIISTDDDLIERFLEYNGWEILTKDLILLISKKKMDDMANTTDIVRVLLAVLDHESTTQPREDWMQLLTDIAVMMPPILDRKSKTLEEELTIADSQVSVLQLTVALLNLAGGGMRKRFSGPTVSIMGKAKQLRTKIKLLKDPDWQESLESLDDVIMGLENLT